RSPSLIGTNHSNSEELAQVKQFGFSNGRDSPDGLENRSGNGAVQAYQGGGFFPANGFSSQGKRCDVHTQFSQGGADVANHPGYIAFAQYTTLSPVCAFRGDASHG